MAFLRRAIIVLAGLLFLLAGQTVLAENRPIKWGITLSGGGAQSFLNPSEQPWAIGYDLRLGWDLRLSPDWRLAVSAGRRRFFDDTTTTSFFKFPDPGSKSSRAWTNTVFNLSLRRLLMPQARLRPYVLAGVGLTSWQIKDYATDSVLRVPGDDGKEKDFKANELHTNLGVGLEYELSRSISARAGFDFFYLTGWGASFARSVEDSCTRGNLVFSLTITAYIGGGKRKKAPPPEKIVKPTGQITAPPVTMPEPTKHDADGDGVPDSTDLCPETPADLLVDAFGCPLDSDGDGVIDLHDECDSTPGGAFVDSVGCPLDSDSDGVYDGLDFCLDTPPEWRAHVNGHGCVSDADGDGVPDFLDKCPDTAPDTPVDSTGCFPDEDKDGVSDAADLCPGTPSGLAVDEDGCLVMTRLERKLLLFPDYEAGLTTLNRIPRKILDDLAVRLVAAPQVKVYIRAFTDNIGEAEANRAISQKRAEKARQYLIERGVAPERITAIGLGEVDFIADNSTAAGRKRNRRLEITYEH